MRLDTNFKFINSELSEELPMTYSIVENNIVKNSTKKDSTHILTSYKDFDAMKEGFITLKIARRFKFKTIKFKVFRDQNYDRIFILLEYDKALKKLKSLDTKDCTFRQLYIYNQITNKKRFLEYLIFNFFIYNTNFDTIDLHYYPDTREIGPLMDISIHDRQDKPTGYLFNVMIESIITPALEYFTKEEILPLIITISNRVLKMVSSKRMLMFYEEQVLEELIKYIKVQQKMAKRYFK